MKNKNFLIPLITIYILISCVDRAKTSQQKGASEKAQKHNPVVYFEIPVTDINRAMAFYRAVLGFDFKKHVIDGNEMALFPFYENGTGVPW